MIQHLPTVFQMINQEDGANPGQGLTVLQTVTYFVVAPIALFAVITVLTLASTREKKKSKTSVITHIE